MLICSPIKTAEIKNTGVSEQIKTQAVKAENAKNKTEKAKTEKVPEDKPVIIVTVPDKPYEEMTIEELQEAILEKMRKNGPVTDYMLGTVRENTHHGSLVTWVRSFN